MQDDKAVRVAPILRYMLGWEREKIRSYVQKRGWDISILRNSTELP